MFSTNFSTIRRKIRRNREKVWNKISNVMEGEGEIDKMNCKKIL